VDPRLRAVSSLVTRVARRAAASKTQQIGAKVVRFSGGQSVETVGRNAAYGGSQATRRTRRSHANASLAGLGATDAIIHT
jgi:hypothetical protein